MKDQTNTAPEEQVETLECDLVEVEKTLDDTTKILFEHFTKRRIDATITMAGLQLVEDTRKACAQGNSEACSRLNLVSRFIERITPEEGAK